MQLSETQWKIIRELSKKDKTPTELVKTLKITLPSIYFQLKQLEAEKLILKTEAKKGKTRPFTRYSLGKGFVYFIRALPGEAQQSFLEIDKNLRLHLRIWSIPQKQYHYYVEGFWWGLQEHIKDVDSVVVFGSVARGDAREGSDIDILLLVNKDVKRYEKMFSAKRIGPRGRKKMVMCQVFTPDDFRNSLQKGSDFAAEVISNSIIIHDPNGHFTKLKNEY